MERQSGRAWARWMVGAALFGISAPALGEESKAKQVEAVWTRSADSSVLPAAANFGAPSEIPVSAPAENLGEPKGTPATPVTEAPCADCGGGAYDFKKVPPVRPMPRLGGFQILPGGPGYYSLWDVIHGEELQNRPKYPYPPFGLMPPGFFDFDWRYLDDPKNTEHDYADCLKRIHVGDNWLFSTGGELRWRLMNEQDARLGLTHNNYDLARARDYTDLWYQDRFRVFAEFISAASFWQNLPTLPIDRDPADMQNLFVDVKLFDYEGKGVYARVGRQEMVLGSQRLVSTLDWANTRRTFDGARILRTGEKWDFDLFWLQPVIPNAQGWSSVANNQNFAGGWLTYRPEKGHFVDAYYMFLDNTSRQTQLGLARAPYSVHTIGGRYAGDRNNFLWDVESAIQLGERGQAPILAGMLTTGLGYHFKNAPMNPIFWLYYDYASGTHNTKDGTNNTFNQLFPFGHYYFGWADQVGRQNINDASAWFYFYPTKWTTVCLQYHHFWLDSATDALYNAGGNAIRRSATGIAGNDVGDEFDIIVNVQLSKHSHILTGYSKFFGGSFIERTNGSTGSTNTDLFYLQYSYRW